jgi:spermidine/putrescine transport system ATP-binding protein
LGESIVKLAGATKTYALPEGGIVTALDRVNLEVARNEFLTLLGPSGCGKTTLLHAISGFVELDDGSIWVDGEDVTGTPPHHRPVNTVFQSYALFPHMTVGDNVGYALDIARVAKAERNQRVWAALELVGLAGLENRKPRQLSGGQQQRVALARAIIGRPKLLLLDEPLSALDRNLRQTMQIELKNLQAELGISFIFVTHDQEEALTMSDRVAVLNKGVIQQIDRPRDAYNRPVNTFVARFLGASNLFDGTLQRDGAKHRVVTDGQDAIELAAADGAMPPAGARVTALLRPEQLSLASAGGPTHAATLDIEVEQIVFIGSTFEILGRTAAGQRVSAIILANHQHMIPEIERTRRARLAYDVAAVHLISQPGTAA